VHKGTSVEDKESKDLPSPKSVNSKGKSVKLLPHYCHDPEDQEVTSSDEDERKGLEQIREEDEEQP